MNLHPIVQALSFVRQEIFQKNYNFFNCTSQRAVKIELFNRLAFSSLGMRNF